MMDPYELHYELTSLLGQFRRQLADSGSGDLTVTPDTYAVAIKAHKQASALLQTLESKEWDEKCLP